LTREVVSLIEEVCAEQLPASVTERLRDRRDRDHAEREQADAQDRAAHAAYTELAERLDTLSPDECEEAIARYEHDHPAGDFHAEQLRRHHDELATIEHAPAHVDPEFVADGAPVE
jgi:hypothetical protein